MPGDHRRRRGGRDGGGPGAGALPRGGDGGGASPVPHRPWASIRAGGAAQGVGVGRERAGVRGAGDGRDAREGGCGARPAHAGRVPGSQGAVRGARQGASRFRRRAGGAGGEARVPEPGEVAAGTRRGGRGAVHRNVRPVPPHEGDGRRGLHGRAQARG